MAGVTLFCDASFDPNSGASGWGAWAKRDDWVQGRQFYGPLPITVLSPSDAEIAGVANALHFLIAAGGMVGQNRLMIQCDCLHALQVLLTDVPGAVASDHEEGAKTTKRKSPQRTPVEIRAVQYLSKFVNELSLRIVLRHVKGHKKGEGRQWVNRTCDALAKKGMKEARRAAGQAKRALQQSHSDTPKEAAATTC